MLSSQAIPLSMSVNRLHSQRGLNLAGITSVSREALAQALLLVAKTSVGALSNVLVVTVRVGEELVYEHRGAVCGGRNSEKVQRHIEVDEVGSLGLANSVHGVHVDVGRVGASHGRSSGDRQRNENVSLVYAVRHKEAVGVVLARKIASESATIGGSR